MAFAITKHTDHILETAIRLFRRDGYEKVSVNEICQEAGISRSSFYCAFSAKRDIIQCLITRAQADQALTLEHFVHADNDFERMWVLCDRYLELAKELGPELMGTLMRLELAGEMDCLSEVHSVDNWLIRLTRNCQASGIMRNTDPAEKLVPMAVDLVYQVCYSWCSTRGSFSLRARARERSEIFYGVAPEYRWTAEQLRNA